MACVILLAQDVRGYNQICQVCTSTFNAVQSGLDINRILIHWRDLQKSRNKITRGRQIITKESAALYHFNKKRTSLHAFSLVWIGYYEDLIIYEIVNKTPNYPRYLPTGLSSSAITLKARPLLPSFLATEETRYSTHFKWWAMRRMRGATSFSKSSVVFLSETLRFYV